MLWIASKPLATWFGAATEDESSVLDQVFGSVLLCIGILILMASKRFRVASSTKENGWLWLLIGYSLLSILWSEMPLIALKRWIRELVAVVMALLLLTEPDPRAAMQSLLRRAAFILIPFSLLLIKYFPSYGVQFRQQGGLMWIGVALQKNSLGRLCVIVIFFLIWLLYSRWRRRVAPTDRYQTLADVSVLILAIYLLSGPEDQYSATSVASLVAGLAVFIGLLLMRRRPPSPAVNVLTLLIVTIITIGILEPFLGGSYLSSISSELGRDATLTGRTGIWESLAPEVKRSPVLGSGFASFWTPMTRDAHQIGEAHNGYMEILLDRGFVGMLLLSAFLLSSSRKARNALNSDYDWGSLWLCFLVIALVHNITESSINTFTSDLTAVLLFLAVSYTVSDAAPQHAPKQRPRGLA